MKKHFMTFIRTLCCILIPCIILTTNVYAATSTISNKTDKSINDMLDAIDKQNFSESNTTAAKAKEIIYHFIYDSTYAVFGGEAFPYPNGGSNVSSVKDNVYNKKIYPGKGCIAYCYFVSDVIYGDEGSRKGEKIHTESSFKTLLQKNGQAGDHIRINNTHSLTFISCTDNGFFALEYGGDKNPNIYLRYWKYYDFVNYSSYKGKKIWLYDANTSENTVENNNSSNQIDAPFSVTNTAVGEFNVTIPANYTLDCYSSPTATTSSTYISAKSSSYTIYCTKQLNMSNGTTRYFFVSGDNKALYFEFTNSMRVIQPTNSYTPTTITYTVTYDANGGTGAPPSKSIVQGEKFTVSTIEPVRSGCIFEGWSTNRNGKAEILPGRVFNNLNSSMTLYAVWKSEKITLIAEIYNNGTATIKYNANGGTGAPNSHTVTKNNNGEATYTLSTIKPTRSGYNFIGWRLDDYSGYYIDSPGQTITFPTGSATSNNDFIYYAQWEAVNTPAPANGTATIKYNANGGTGAPNSHTVTKNNNGEATYTLSTIKPTRSGYNFIGWRLDDYSGYYIDSPGQTITFPTGSATSNNDFIYYAQWEAISVSYGTVTIQYNANGGTGAPYSHSVTKDQYGIVRYSLSLTEPTRDGYIFYGWLFDNSIVYDIDAPGQRIIFELGNATISETLTYYAVWVSVWSSAANNIVGRK